MSGRLPIVSLSYDICYTPYTEYIKLPGKFGSRGFWFQRLMQPKLKVANNQTSQSNPPSSALNDVNVDLDWNVIKHSHLIVLERMQANPTYKYTQNSHRRTKYTSEENIILPHTLIYCMYVYKYIVYWLSHFSGCLHELFCLYYV